MKIVCWWIFEMLWLAMTVCLAGWTMTRNKPEPEFLRFLIYFMSMVMWISGSFLLLIFYFGPRFG